MSAQPDPRIVAPTTPVPDDIVDPWDDIPATEVELLLDFAKNADRESLTGFVEQALVNRGLIEMKEEVLDLLKTLVPHANTPSMKNEIAKRGLTLATAIDALRDVGEFPRELLPSRQTCKSLQEMYVISWRNK